MGFFDLKATCGVCENQVGLNRYKIKKSNSWICPKCVAKLGGIGSFHVNKVTIEELKEMARSIYERKEALENDSNSPVPKSAEGMYKYCVDNDFGKGYNEYWALKHFQVIETILTIDEEVYMTFIGLHNYESNTKHENNYAYAITNKRILFAQKQTIAGEKYKSIKWKNINDIGYKSGLVFGLVEVDTTKEKFNVAINKASANKVSEKLFDIIDQLKNDISASDDDISSYKSNQYSVADELKKFKELLDMGVITQEEFDSQKKKLL